MVSGISAARPAPPPTTPVLVAAHDVGAGAVLEPGDLDAEDWPAVTVPEGALHSRDDALGLTVAAPLRAGEPLTDVRLLQATVLAGYPAGSVLTTVRIADPAAAALVHVGDVVDIVGADPQARRGAGVVASGVRVVSVPPAPEATAVSDGIVLVVAVDEGTALRLADAAVREQLSVLLAG